MEMWWSGIWRCGGLGYGDKIKFCLQISPVDLPQKCSVTSVLSYAECHKLVSV